MTRSQAPRRRPGAQEGTERPEPSGEALARSAAPTEPLWAKYGNRKVSLDGYTFDSHAEGNRYVVLRERLRAGEIMDLEVHPSYRLEVDGQLVCHYVADFAYHDPETYAETVEDVKSPITRRNRDYRIKVKLMWACHGIRVREIV